MESGATFAGVSLMTVDDTGDATIVVGAKGGNEVGHDSQVAPKAKLICLNDSLLDPKQKGLEIVLSDGVHTVGRGADNTDPIFYQGVSSRHARIFPLQGKWAVEDLGSTNGVWIKGVRQQYAFLVPGDYIKFGTIPFQFVLDGPAHETGSVNKQENTGSSDDATMFLSRHNEKVGQIVDSLTAAQREIVNDVKEHKEVRRTVETRSHPAQSGVAASSGKKFSTMIVLFVLLLVLAGGGGWYITQKGPGGSDELQQHQKSVRQFSDEHEIAKGTLTDGELEKQVDRLEGMRKLLSADAEKYTGNVDLKKLLVRLRFLSLERVLLLSLQAGSMQQAESMIGELLTFVQADWTKVSEKQATKVSEEPVWLEDMRDMRDLLELAKGVVIVKRFRQEYPQPSKEAAARPTPEAVAAMGKISETIVKHKKAAGINILLTVQFPLFGRVVSQVDAEDLPVISQWKELQ